MAKRIKQSTMDEFIESGGKGRKKHADISQDVSESGNSGNELLTTNDMVENIDTGDEEERETSHEGYDFDQSDSSRIKLKKEMSLYKVNNDRVKGLNTVDEGNDNDFETCIIKQLEEDKHLKVKDIKRKDCYPFKITWFYYITEKKINTQSSQIAIDREATNGQRLPGDRKTGNILMYYRFLNGAPEVYLLCDGAAFHAILHLVDNNFRTNFAKCFLDEQCIKEIETMNIAGPDIQVKTTFKMRTQKTLHTILYFDKVISSLTGILKKDCGLYEIVYGRVDSEKIINLMIGLNFVRICEKMSYEMWAKIIQVISDEVSKPIPATNISTVLDFVRPVSDKCQRQKLSSTMSNEAIDVILEKKQSDDFYLSHRYARDFLLSSDVRLVLEKSGPRNNEVLREWKSVPSLLDVINEIRKKIDIRNLEKDLNDRNIILKYWTQTGKMVREAVQNYIHGSIQVENELFHKIGSKWYQLSTHFSQTVDRMFTDFSRNCTFQKDEEARMRDVFKYPWKHSDKQFDIQDETRFSELGKRRRNFLWKYLLTVV